MREVNGPQRKRCNTSLEIPTICHINRPVGVRMRKRVDLSLQIYPDGFDGCTALALYQGVYGGPGYMLQERGMTNLHNKLAFSNAQSQRRDARCCKERMK